MPLPFGWDNKRKEESNKTSLIISLFVAIVAILALFLT
jgi:hypothetical protein